MALSLLDEIKDTDGIENRAGLMSTYLLTESCIDGGDVAGHKFATQALYPECMFPAGCLPGLCSFMRETVYNVLSGQGQQAIL